MSSLCARIALPLLLVAAGGCGSTDAVCLTGEPLSCTCADGLQGTTTCDGLGQPGACSCDVLGPDEATWSRRLGDEREQSLIALAAGPDGVVVVGGFEGTLEVGGLPLVSAGARDIFVASFDPGGGHRWSRRFGGPGDDFGLAVAVGPDGEVYVAGGYTEELRLPATEAIILTGEGFTDAFVMRLTDAGETVWARSWGSLGFDAIRRITYLPAGQIIPSEGSDVGASLYVGGYYQQTLTYDGGVLSGRGGTDAMMGRILVEDGATLFFEQIGAAGNDTLGGIASDGTQLYAVGGFQGMAAGLPNTEDGNAFLLSLDNDGVLASASYFVGAGRDDGRDVAFAGDQVWVAGRFQQQLERQVPPATFDAVGGQDIYLAPFVGGTYGDVHTFGDAGREEVTTLASDGDDLLMAGGFDGTLDFGLGALSAAGPGDGYAVRIDGTTGAPLEQVLVSSTGFAQVESAAFDAATDRWWLAGRFEGTLTLGDETLVSAGQSDVFIAAVRAD